MQRKSNVEHNRGGSEEEGCPSWPGFLAAEELRCVPAPKHHAPLPRLGDPWGPEPCLCVLAGGHVMHVANWLRFWGDKSPPKACLPMSSSTPARWQTSSCSFSFCENTGVDWAFPLGSKKQHKEHVCRSSKTGGIWNQCCSCRDWFKLMHFVFWKHCSEMPKRKPWAFLATEDFESLYLSQPFTKNQFLWGTAPQPLYRKWHYLKNIWGKTRGNLRASVWGFLKS